MLGCKGLTLLWMNMNICYSINRLKLLWYELQRVHSSKQLPESKQMNSDKWFTEI